MVAAGGVGVAMSMGRFALLLLSLALVVPRLAAAKPGYGDNVDAFCSAQGRGTPFADGAGQGFLSECGLCHQFTYPPSLPDKSNTFDPPARDYTAGKRSGDFSAFCPGIANQLPAITPIADRSVLASQMVVIDVSASDADGDPLVLSVSNAPSSSTFVDKGNGSATFTWTPALGDIGSHTVTFLARDNATPPGQAMEAVVITVDSSNRPPQLGAIGNRSGDPGVLLEIPVTASDPDNDALVLSATPLPTGASFSDAGDGSGTFRWTPGSSQMGNFVVTFRVTDTGVPPAEDSERVTLTIGRVNARPSLDPIGNRSTKLGQPLHLDLHASDPDGDGLMFEAMGLPPDASFSDIGAGTAAIDWTPATANPSSYRVTVSVTDDGIPPESVSESFDLGVAAESPPSAARLDDVSWKRKGGSGGRLRVRGSGANPEEMVGVLDSDSGLVLGSRKASRRGDFKLKIEPIVAPCAVQVQASEVRGAPVPVRGAPASCGSEPSLSVQATWGCADAGLEVEGARAPVGAQIEFRDAANGTLLGTTQADKRGRFRFAAPLAVAPAAIEALVTAGEFQWSSGPVAVQVGCNDDEDEARGGDSVEPPKKRHRSADREDD
jgi:Putative Ig domain/Bacterial Ig domain